jgi:competence protein ComEC
VKKGVVIFWSIFLAAAIFRVWQSFQTVAPDIGLCLKENVSGTGTIDDEPQRAESGQILVISVGEASITGSGTASPVSQKECSADFLLRVKTKLYPEFAFGDHVSFQGKLLEPMNFGSGDSGREFDYKGYLAKDDVFYEMKSATVAKIDERTGEESSEKITASNLISSAINRVTLLLYSLKAGFVMNLERTLGEPQAALASGLVVGEKAALGNDLLVDFRTVGLIHIVVLSGYNITIVAYAMRRLLSFLPRIWGIGIGGIGIALFGVLVGGGATVVRSCVMAGIALSADLLRRDYNVTRALALAALIMLIENPMILLHDVSFQLSFLATLGLILLAGPVEERLGFIPDTFGLRGIIAATISTQIFVTPFILYIMGQISIIGVVVNILVLPSIPPTMLFVFLTGAGGFVFMPVAQFFGWISHLLLSYELFMVQNFARLPFAAAHVPPFSIWWVIGFYAVFLGGFVVVKKMKSSNKSKKL